MLSLFRIAVANIRVVFSKCNYSAKKMKPKH